MRLLSPLGLEPLESAEGVLTVSRHGRSVDLDASRLGEETLPDRQRTAWVLLGVRYGLDRLEALAAPAPADDGPMRFRRTNIRRYQEAPSVHGDDLPRLVPTAVGQVFEEITGERLFTAPGIRPKTEVLVVHEEGLLRKALTESDRTDLDESDDALIDRVRRALFYDSYKLRARPVPESPPELGLKKLETVEGLGATRALLYPEFDYDLAQDGGLLSIPSRDVVLLAAGTTDEHRRALRALTEEVRDAAAFPFSSALFELTATELRLLEEPEAPDNDLPTSSAVEGLILSGPRDVSNIPPEP